MIETTRPRNPKRKRHGRLPLFAPVPRQCNRRVYPERLPWQAVEGAGRPRVDAESEEVLRTLDAKLDQMARRHEEAQRLGLEWKPEENGVDDQSPQ